MTGMQWYNPGFKRQITVLIKYQRSHLFILVNKYIKSDYWVGSELVLIDIRQTAQRAFDVPFLQKPGPHDCWILTLRRALITGAFSVG